MLCAFIEPPLVIAARTRDQLACETHRARTHRNKHYYDGQNTQISKVTIIAHARGKPSALACTRTPTPSTTSREAVGAYSSALASPFLPSPNLSTTFSFTHGVVPRARLMRSGTAKRATFTKANASAPSLLRSSWLP